MYISGIFDVIVHLALSVYKPLNNYTISITTYN